MRKQVFAPVLTYLKPSTTNSEIQSIKINKQNSQLLIANWSIQTLNSEIQIIKKLKKKNSKVKLSTMHTAHHSSI